MPSISKKQRTLACIALAIKQGKGSHLKNERSVAMAESMTEEQLEEFCKQPVK